MIRSQMLRGDVHERVEAVLARPVDEHEHRAERSQVSATASSTWARSETSTAHAIASPPLSRMSCAARSACSRSTIEHRDLGPVAGQTFGDRQPDARRPPGHDRGRPRERHLHSASDSGAISVDGAAVVILRTSATSVSIGVPVGNTALAPISSSGGTSARGTVPPTTTLTSPAPQSRSASTVLRVRPRCAPERIDRPTRSTSSCDARSTRSPPASGGCPCRSPRSPRRATRGPRASRPGRVRRGPASRPAPAPGAARPRIRRPSAAGTRPTRP